MRIDNIDTVRSILFWALLLALIGTGTELLLLGHVEGATQLIPLALIAAGIIVFSWHAIGSGAASIRTLQVLMILFMVAGVVGVVLHFRSNIEFELELYPTMEGMELFRKAATGALPALAPGAMIQIGLVGFAYTWKHPALEYKP